MRHDIHFTIIKAIQKKYRGVSHVEFSVSIPDGPEYGDYATNAAFLLAKKLQKPPLDIARELAAECAEEKMFKKVSVAASGFINFWLSDEVLYGELGEILQKKNTYGKLQTTNYKLSTINIEFISANPTGPLTIGNGRGAFLGDVLANILSFSGSKVTREYYINDAKASTQIQELGKAILRRSEAYPGPYTDSIKVGLKKKYATLSEMGGDTVGYLAAQEIQKDNKKTVEKILKIKFDVWYSEEKLYKNRLVQKTLNALNGNGVMYQKDGAMWFRASEFGDSEDRVALRTGGAPTYFLPDVAYHFDKLTKRKFQKVIDILGADHHGTFPRVVAGLRALGLDAESVTPIFTQIARLTRSGKEVKMSKRRGEFVTLEELIKEVGLDAARYFFLEKSPDTHMDFDLDLAKEQSVKNPVYYIQYAHARITSIFNKVKNRGIFNFQFSIFKLLKEDEELSLIKKLIQFPEVVADTANDYQVHRLTRYAYELARVFHNFYEKHRVITDDKELTQARLAFVKATQVVLQNVLGLLGISAPKKM